LTVVVLLALGLGFAMGRVERKESLRALIAEDGLKSGRLIHKV
jgi:hypothetical protein